MEAKKNVYLILTAVFGYFNPLNEEADPEVVRFDQRSCRKQFGAFVNGQRIDDGILVLDGK